MLQANSQRGSTLFARLQTLRVWRRCRPAVVRKIVTDSGLKEIQDLRPLLAAAALAGCLGIVLTAMRTVITRHVVERHTADSPDDERSPLEGRLGYRCA